MHIAGTKGLDYDRAPPIVKHHYRMRAETKEKQARLLAVLEQGGLVKEALEAAPCTHETLKRWRQRYPSFDKQYQALRNRFRHVKHPTDVAHYGKGFVQFRKRYFGYDTYWHQQKIIDAIEKAKPGRIVMVLAPPEHGKTSVIEDYINYQLALDPNMRITYVHESRDFARKVMSRVKARMTDMGLYPDYVAAWGPFHSNESNRPWTADHITVEKAQHDERDYSLQVRGWSTSVQGTRTDLLLLDDVQAVKSLNLTEKLALTLRQDFFSRPGAKAKIVMVGTRVGPGDIYEAFQADPALNDLIDLINLPALDEEGNPLCPEMWTGEDLKRKRALVGEEAWWRNYQQAPRSSSIQTFNEHMVNNAKDPMLRVGYVDPGEPTVLGLDPALGGGNALIACSYTRDQLNVVDLDFARGLSRTEDILNKIQAFATMYRPIDVIIETEAFQRGLARDERLQQMGQRLGFRVIEHRTAGEKADPVLGVAMMAGAFIRREIRIPWGDQQAAERFEPLTAQLLAWRPDIPTRLLTQDCPMALWFVWKWWMEHRQQLSVTVDAWNTVGLNYRTRRKARW